MADYSETASSSPIAAKPIPVPVVPPNPLAPALGSSYAGIDFDTQASTSNYYQIPPDPHCAAGPSHVVTIVNTAIDIYVKSTGVNSLRQRLGHNGTTAVGSFFATLSPVNSLFDPKVIYDQYNGRFIVVALEKNITLPVIDAGDTSRILLAVSKSSDPTAGWWFQAINSKINISGTDYWADYPGIAVDNQAVYITNSMFSMAANAWGSSYLWIIAKGQGSGGFYDADNSATFTVHDPYSATSQSLFSMTTMPAHMFGTPPTNFGTFLVGYGGLTNDTTTPSVVPTNAEFLQVINVTNPLGTPSFSHQFIVVGHIEEALAAMPDAPQSGTGITIETNDRRMLDVVWRNNSLWCTAQIYPYTPHPDAGQVTAHWWQLNTTTPASISVTQQGDAGGEDIATGAYTFMPSIAVNKFGDMALGFALSASSIYCGAYYTGRLAGDTLGTVQATGTLAAGTDYYNRFLSGTRNRWGDYSGMTLDPSDETTFWMFNEFAKTRGTIVNPPSPTEDGRWDTKWGSFAFVTPTPTMTPTSTLTPTATPTATPTPTVTLTATPTPTATITPVSTPTPTSTPTNTPIPTPTQTVTPIPTATQTVVPTITPTITPTPSATVSHLDSWLVR